MSTQSTSLPRPHQGRPESLRRDATEAGDSDDVTLLVFKDNDASRSFQVSLGWISRLGFALGIVIVLAVAASFFAVKYYRIARSSDPLHVLGLEQQLSDLKAANQGLESKLAVAVKNQTAVPTAAPAPKSTAAAPAPVAVAMQSVPGSIPLFSALPRDTKDLSGSSSKLPITVSPPHASWKAGGRGLRVTFNIQYVGEDRGSQQGHIIVLARGPSALLSYPAGALNAAGSDALIESRRGEYFSVSRFRAVKADFPELAGASIGQLKELEILILSLDNELLFYQKVALTSLAKPAAARPPVTKRAAMRPAISAPIKPLVPKPAAKTDPSALIQPGVDQ